MAPILKMASIALTTPLIIVWYTWLAACATVIPMHGFNGDGRLFALWCLTIVGVVARERMKGGA